jgi:hypothetical protein
MSKKVRQGLGRRSVSSEQRRNNRWGTRGSLLPWERRNKTKAQQKKKRK